MTFILLPSRAGDVSEKNIGQLFFFNISSVEVSIIVKRKKNREKRGWHSALKLKKSYFKGKYYVTMFFDIFHCSNDFFTGALSEKKSKIVDFNI